MTDTANSLGPRLTDAEERLYRQVHPSFVQAGRPSSQAFRPTPKDGGLLSVSRASLTTPERALEHHTKRLQLKSIGVWAFTVDDCTRLDLEAFADPITSPERDDAHAVVDFRGLAEAEVRRRAQLLKAAAGDPLYLASLPSV